MDFGNSHHFANDFNTFSLHFEYGGTNDILLGNGNSVPIFHTSSTFLPSYTCNFMLNIVLCAPSLTKNLLSLSQFCK